MHALALGVLMCIAFARTACAQDDGPDPATMRVHFGPLLMNPRLELSNVGIDSNVFNEATDPKRDFTVTVTPTTDVWLRLGRSWLQVNIGETIVWYQKYASERSANNTYSINWKLALNRLVVNVAPKYVSTRDRPSNEIDARAHRLDWGATTDIGVRMLAKTFIGVNLQYDKLTFDNQTVFLDSDLHDALSRTTTGVGLSVRHQLTPLTTIAVNVSRQQDRFLVASARDSNSTVGNVTVSFDPHALLKGSASFGYRRFDALDPGTPDFAGATATGTLSYTLLGATRFEAQFKRDVAYSYDLATPYYLENSIQGSIAQQVFGPFDVVGRLGTTSLAYRNQAGATVLIPDRTDYVRSYGFGVGYHMGKDLRLGLNADRQHRISEVDTRQYDGWKYGTSLTYDF